VSFDIDAWTVLQNQARSKDVFNYMVGSDSEGSGALCRRARLVSGIQRSFTVRNVSNAFLDTDAGCAERQHACETDRQLEK
jgi:hypothetical protein